MNTPLVSVVIPTYNRAYCLKYAIDSVLKQTYKNYEIIVVDDGSTDDTKQIIEQYGNKLVYLSQQNAGVSAARNKGIRRSNGEWVAFLDSDDEWLPEKLENQLSHINNNPCISIHVTNASVITGGVSVGGFSIRGNPKLALNGGVVVGKPMLLILKMGFFTPSYLVRKKSLLDVGLFDEQMSLYEDRDLFLRLSTKFSLGVINERLVNIITRGDDSLSTNQESNESIPLFSSIRTFEKLLKSYPLIDVEQKEIKKRLSAAYFHLARIQLQNKEQQLGYSNIRNSLNNSLGIKSLLRVFVRICFGESFFTQLYAFKDRKKIKFYRSSN